MKIKSFTANDMRVIFLSSLGGMLEFYDFIIYGVFSVYFANSFFVTHNDLLTIIASYVVFVLGYIARPFGGIIFSYIGDEKGRKKVLVITVMLMGFASLGIGILPTYNTIGIYAPILLLLLRLMQGFALGGELPSTYVYIRESITKNTVIAFGILMSIVISGLLLGSIINYLINLIVNKDIIIKFMWRAPFIFGALLCIVGYRIRKQLQETNLFLHLHNKTKNPFALLFQYHASEFFIASIVVGVLSASIVTFLIFMPTYLYKILKITHEPVASYVLIATIVAVLVALIVGFIANSSKLTNGRMFRLAIIIAVVITTLAFYMIYQHLLLSLILLGIVTGIFTTISPTIITTLFPGRVSLSGVALSYNIGFTIFGGLSPVIVSYAIKKGGGVTAAPLTFMMIVFFLGFISSYYIDKYNHLKTIN